jgi:hypothetical protein
VFSAAIAPSVDAGTIAFSENGRALLGCTTAPLRTPSRGVTFAVYAAKSGTFNITAMYSGDSSFASSAATFTQVVKPAIVPPREHVGQSQIAKPAGTHPNFSLILTAARTNHAPHHYRFTAENVSCDGGASAVQITVGASTTQVPCKARLAAASKQLAGHRTYKITARAVRFDRKHRITARGPLYRLSLYMPGDEARWVPAGA